MAEKAYYIKIRGRVLGPVDAKRLVQMIRDGSVSRIHKLSTDGKNWRSASEFPKFFEAAAQSGKRRAEARPAAKPPTEQQAGRPQKNRDLAPDLEDDSEEWYYGINGQSTGPVSKSTLRELLSSGQLSQEDMLWKKGMGDWQRARTFNEFGAMVASKGARPAVGRPQANHTSPTSGRNSFSDSVVIDGANSVSNVMRSSNVWVYICLIYLYLQSIATGFTAVLNLIQAVQRDELGVAILAALGVVVTGLLVAATVSLHRYATASSRFGLTGETNELLTATKFLGKFWMWICAILIFGTTVVLVAVLYDYSVFGAFVNG
ncbi:DUF4339 domain-containing protein [bacterium]|nr:DUF4339 domain-containing protein [bacterium]